MEFQSTSFQSLGSWLGRLLRLDLTVFDDVKDDVGATAPALAVVALASLLAGLGSWLWWIFEIDLPAIMKEQLDIGEKNFEAFWKTFILGSIFMAALWLLWVYISAMILSRGFRASADLSQLMRTMGLAFAPMAVSFLVFVSVLAVPFGVIAIAATLLLSNAAMQATTDGEPGQVVLANLTGFAVFAVLLGILSNIARITFDFGGGTELQYGGLAPGLFFVYFDLSL